MTSLFSYAPRVAFPLSGDVTQDILPAFTGMKGVPEYEHAIATQVWSYGAQLGALTDVLIEVLDQLALAEESAAMGKLRAKAAEMAVAKESVLTNLKDRMDRLEQDLARLEGRNAAD